MALASTQALIFYQLTCDGNAVVPRNGFGLTQYPFVVLLFIICATVTESSRDKLGPYQACTLFGAQSGSDIIPGDRYLAVGYGLDVNDMWRRNFLVLVAFFFFFQITQIVALEFFPVRQSSFFIVLLTDWIQLQQLGLDLSINIFAKEDEETKRLNDRQRQRKDAKLTASEKDGQSIADPASKEQSVHLFPALRLV